MGGGVGTPWQSGEGRSRPRPDAEEDWTIGWGEAGTPRLGRGGELWAWDDLEAAKGWKERAWGRPEGGGAG